MDHNKNSDQQEGRCCRFDCCIDRCPQTRPNIDGKVENTEMVAGWKKDS